MSSARCNPERVEAAAAEFRAACGRVPRVVAAASEVVKDLVSQFAHVASQREAEVTAASNSGAGQMQILRMAAELDTARERLNAASAIAARLGELRKVGDRIDASCESLAGHLAEVARFARDVARGGMPTPHPPRGSETFREVQEGLADALRGTGVLGGDLPALTPDGPGAPADPRDAILPTDNTFWWER